MAHVYNTNVAIARSQRHCLDIKAVVHNPSALQDVVPAFLEGLGTTVRCACARLPLEKHEVFLSAMFVVQVCTAEKKC